MSGFDLFNSAFIDKLLKKIEKIDSIKMKINLLHYNDFVKSSFAEIANEDLTDNEIVLSARAYETLWEQKVIQSFWNN